MERIKSLNLYQKIVLVILIAMTLVFAVLYPVTMRKTGYLYSDTILEPSEKDGNTVYSGKIRGVDAEFTVSGSTVVFRCGSKTYGPYTLREDATAVPAENPMGEAGGKMTGLELSCKGEVIFRGFEVEYGSGRMLFNEIGEHVLDIRIEPGNGTIAVDENGNEIDSMEPAVSDIIELIRGPKLTHKGLGRIWFAGFAICLLTAVSILFANELFRHQMKFVVAEPESVEPSGLEIARRYVGWTILTAAAFGVYLLGLRQV